MATKKQAPLTREQIEEFFHQNQDGCESILQELLDHTEQLKYTGKSSDLIKKLDKIDAISNRLRISLGMTTGVGLIMEMK